MAYAQKVTEFSAIGKGDTLQAWFGNDAPLMPGPVIEAPSREHQERGKQELARAIRVYADVVARAPDNFIAHLGYAWCLEQSLDKPKAIAEYRKVVALAWPKVRGDPCPRTRSWPCLAITSPAMASRLRRTRRPA